MSANCDGRLPWSAGCTRSAAAPTTWRPTAVNGRASTITSGGAWPLHGMAAGGGLPPHGRRRAGFPRGPHPRCPHPVRDAMFAASEREDYERARDLRDALKWLEKLEEPSTIETIGKGDADIVGYARDRDDAVCVLLRVRDGRVIAGSTASSRASTRRTTTRRWETSWSSSTASPTPGPAAWWCRSPPPTGTPSAISWRAPSGGAAARDGPPLARAGRWHAWHLFDSLRLESFETEERSEDPVYALGRDLGLSIVPRSFI